MSNIRFWYMCMFAGGLISMPVLGFWPTVAGLAVIGFLPVAVAPYAQRRKRGQ